MPLSCELLAPGEPVPAEWDRFVVEQGLLRAWDAAAFVALAAAGQGRWLGLVHEQGRPVGLVCGRLRGRPGPALFECKMPWVGLPGFAVAATLERDERRAALAAFERALRRRLGWRCPAVLYRVLDAEELALVRGFGRAVIRTPYPRAVLRNDWASMDEYWLSLRRKLRHRLRSQYRQLERDPDLVVELGGGPVDGAEAARLMRLTLLRHERRLPAAGGPPPAYLEALSGRGVLYLTYRDGAERLLGVGLVFDDGRWMTDSLWGSLDPGDGGRPNIYFHRFLRLISYMVERRRAGMNCGRGMLEIKQRYGCQAVAQHLVVGLR
jgi:hypothetical protein